MLGLRRTTACLLAVAALATLPACSEEPEPVGAPAAPGEPPTLERAWQIPGYGTLPEAWNDRYWLTSGIVEVWSAGGVTFQGPGFAVYDARTGTKAPVELAGDPCGIPALTARSTAVALEVNLLPRPDGWSKAEHQSGAPRPESDCSGEAVLDLTDGTRVWQWDGKGRRPGDLPAPPEALPLLFEEDGAPLTALSDVRELGRVDDVLVVSGQQDGREVVRAHDLTTGATLWVDELDRDELRAGDPWARDEAYGATGTELLRFDYDRDDEEPSRSVARISSVDPHTGEEIAQVGVVPGGLFLAQVGDVAVMAVDEERMLRSRLAGFVIPATQ